MINIPRHRLRPILAIVGLGILATTLWWIGIDAVLASVAALSPSAITVAISAVVVSTLLGAWNCYQIAELQRTLSFASFLPVFWRSWAVGITLPGQVGDFLTTLWQLKGRSVDLNLVAGRLIVDKTITLVLMLGLVSLLPTVIGKPQPILSLVLLGGVGAGVVLSVALLGYWRRNPDLLARSNLGRRAMPVLTGTDVPRRLVFSNVAVTVGKLLATGAVYWSVMSSVATEAPSFVTTIIVSQSAGLIAYVPISFNGLGTVELSGVAMFGELGVQAVSVLSAYVAIRAITLTVAWLPVGVITLLPVSEVKR